MRRSESNVNFHREWTCRCGFECRTPGRDSLTDKELVELAA
jgi:hypothetical protein